MFTQLTVCFRVLEYNNAPVELINDSISLISTFDRNSSCSNNSIFTIEDLNIVEETSNDSNDINRETPVKPKSRWILIEGNFNKVSSFEI